MAPLNRDDQRMRRALRDVFMYRANQWAQHNHPNVIKLYGVYHIGEPYYMGTRRVRRCASFCESRTTSS